MKREHNWLVMNDGTKYYCNLGIVGISPKLEISEGCDGLMKEFDNDDDYAEMVGDTFKPAPSKHKKELADYMIGLWQQYKETIKI